MTDPVKEQLSACLDGELPESELDLVLKQVSRDPQLSVSLGRYALIGEALRGQGAVAAQADFSKRIAAAVSAEPPLSSVTKPSAPAVRQFAHKSARWLHPAAGFAVAAGVAAIAILALQRPAETPDASYVADTLSPAPVGETISSDPASYIVPANTGNSAYVPAARLTNYVVAHSEYSTPLGRRSVLSGVLSDEVEGDADPSDDATSEPRSTDDSPQP